VYCKTMMARHHLQLYILNKQSTISINKIFLQVRKMYTVANMGTVQYFDNDT